jgi:hypothetical protein
MHQALFRLEINSIGTNNCYNVLNRHFKTEHNKSVPTLLNRKYDGSVTGQTSRVVDLNMDRIYAHESRMGTSKFLEYLMSGVRSLCWCRGISRFWKYSNSPNETHVIITKLKTKHVLKQRDSIQDKLYFYWKVLYAALQNLAEYLCLSALPALKVGYSQICPVGAQTQRQGKAIPEGRAIA